MMVPKKPVPQPHQEWRADADTFGDGLRGNSDYEALEMARNRKIALLIQREWRDTIMGAAHEAPMVPFDMPTRPRSPLSRLFRWLADRT